MLSKTKRLYKNKLQPAILKTLKFGFKLIFKTLKKLHHTFAVIPHEHLMFRWGWYNRWHQKKSHHALHVILATAYVLVMGFLVLGAYKAALAAGDLSNSWDFTTASNYTLDSGLQTSGSTVTLKPNEYSSDADTSALYHLNDGSGTTASDSSSNANNGTTVNTPSWITGQLNGGLSLDGVSQYFTAPDSASLSLSQKNSLEAWTKFSSPLTANSIDHNQSVVDKGSYKLYFDKSSGKLTYELENDSATWSQKAGPTAQYGNGLNSSWNTSGKAHVYSMVQSGSTEYAALGGANSGDAQVWKWNGTTWSQVGGSGLNSSWTTPTSVNYLYINGTRLYAAVNDSTTNIPYIWYCDLSSSCSSWTQSSQLGSFGATSIYTMVVFSGKLWIGVGNGTSVGIAECLSLDVTTCGASSSFGTGHDSVRSLVTDGTYTYWGLGDGASDADVYRCDATPTCTQIGGDSLNSGWTTGFTQTNGLTLMGGNLYATIGKGTGNANGQVWKWNGTSWAQIGGNAVNSSWSNPMVEGLTNDGTNVYAGISDGTVWRWNGTAWTQIGGFGAASTWTYSNQIDSLDYNSSSGHLYAGISDGAILNGLVYDDSTPGSSSFSGTYIGGRLVNSGWGISGLASVTSLTYYNGILYAGVSGGQFGTALVYKYSGTSWSLVGGQANNGSWPVDTYNSINDMRILNGQLCASVTSNILFSIYCYNGSTWTKIGDQTNFTGTLTLPGVMEVFHNKLYLSVNNSPSTGRSTVYSYDGSTWTSEVSTANSNFYHYFTGMAIVNDTLYAGYSQTICSSTCTGAGLFYKTGAGGSWSSDITCAGSIAAGSDCVLIPYNGTLYVDNGGSIYTFNKGTNTFTASAATFGCAATPHVQTEYNGYLYYGCTNGKIYKFDGSTSSVAADAGVGASGWPNPNNFESVPALISNNGSLWAGTGTTGDTDPQVWQLSGNTILQSSQTSWDTNWHHIAATYDGLTMKLYVDGALSASKTTTQSLPDNPLSLIVGSSYATEQGSDLKSYFAGSLDEVRISDIARTSFNDLPYPTTAQTVTLNTPVRTSGVWHWDSWTDSETANGGTVKYRLSNDNGATWLYWDGAAWSTSSSTSQSNDVATASANMATFPVTFGGLKWQAILQGNGNQAVTLNSVGATATSDTIAPITNASNITALKAAGGSALSSGAWTNGSSPYFSWTAGVDNESGVKGYCLYLGQDNTADPVTTKGLLGSGPLNVNGQCQFAISGTSIDLSTAGYIATAMTSSSLPYYFTIKTIDNAGNVSAASTQFNFKFDNTPPSNPTYISGPSGFVANKAVTLTWPTSGTDAPSDANSGLAGLQYRINGGTWYGDSHTGSGDINDLLTNDGSYTTQNPPDFSNLNEGTNTIDFRSWDQAGNVTTGYVSAAIKINTTGAPSAPLNLVATPSSNTSNSFAFSWDAPTTFNGNATNIVYCYTVNTLPSSSTCTWTQPGVTNLAAGPYATQPGSNTFYVVAKDETGGINYSTYTSVVFTANTTAPGIPLNLVVTDVSVRDTSNWRLALTWEQPSDVGSGVSTYKIYRSTDGTNYSPIGASSSTSYVDGSLNQVLYYYKIEACDSTNNCGAFSTVVSDTPTGKYTSPASLTGQPAVSDVTTHKATVHWNTDRASDSRIAFGTSSGHYAAAEIVISAQVTDHTINLENLSAGTTYYGVAKWTDVDGNTGTSAEFTFTTDHAPSLKEITTTNITTNSATVTFTSQSTSKVALYYGPTDSFGSVITVNTSSSESTYSIPLTGLNDGTKYFYKLVSYDSENFAYDGSIFSFTTLPQPHITNLRFQPVSGEPTSTQKVTWDTNVASNSIVTYGPVGTDGVGISDPKLTTSHEITISNLQDNTQYFLVAQSRDASGNTATSDKQVFHTALDTRPPKISNITVEASIRGTGADAKGQVIVSWHTDEPSTSQVGYAAGANVSSFTSKTAEDSALSYEHIVIVSDLPTSRVFSVAPISADKAGNKSVGDSQPAIIGRANDSILTIVLNTLQKVFGF